MDKIWEYSRGQWGEIAWSVAPECEEEELRKAGWEMHHRIGTIDVWERTGALLLVLHLNPYADHPRVPIICSDLPSYLMFRKEFG